MTRKRPSRRKYHFIYETRCLVTGKFYRGKHSTDDLEDGYLGSGNWIRRGVEAHGKERYERTVLEFCSYEELDSREVLLISEGKLNPLCMNIAKGGDGGKTSGSFTTETARSAGILSCRSAAGRMARSRVLSNRLKVLWKDPEFRENMNNIRSAHWTGKAHSEETRAKMSSVHSERLKDPTKNSQYGTCWISHPEHGSRKIKKDELDSYLQIGWRRGRK